MIGAVREWLLGVLCAAVLAALADRLSPQGAAGKIGRMAGGLLLLIAVVRPVVQADLSVLASASLPVWEEIGEAAWAETDMGLLENIIGEETGAYILDKAEELGIPCTRVEVTCEEKDGVPYPSSVRISGPIGEAQRRALSRTIEADLAIPADRQTYESEDHLS